MYEDNKAEYIYASKISGKFVTLLGKRAVWLNCGHVGDSKCIVETREGDDDEASLFIVYLLSPPTLTYFSLSIKSNTKGREE